MDYNIIRLYIFGIITIILTACNQQGVDISVHEKDFLYKSSDHYEIKVPEDFSYNEYAPSGKYYYFGYPINNKIGIRSIEFYPLPSHCSPSTTGASKRSTLTTTTGEWGRVDFYDGSDWIYAPEPFPVCTPPRPQPNSKPTAYAFCSQKEEKTVLICISQMTDNPKLAEEIFSTFRWTK